jgi:DNA-binding CsgD family transcriptional regulator
MKRSSILAHIRQLCCLGLGGEAIMPSLLRELHELVPCDSAGFFWVDEAGEMSNLYAERLLPPDLMRLYFKRFYEDRERGFRKGFARLAQNSAVVSSASFDEAFYRSEYYNLVLRHLDAHFLLYALIREGGSPLGQLSLYRPRKSVGFSAADREQLASVTRYIAHGLHTGPIDDPIRNERGEAATAVVVLDRLGRPVHIAPDGERILFLASHPRISPAALAREEGDIPNTLRELCQRIDKLFKDEPASPPVARIENGWGSFVFRAYPLGAAGGMSGGLVAVTIHHREPLSLTLMRSMKKSGLSAKQKEVMLLLAGGNSQQQIAQRLGVSQNTASYHVRQLYNKLDAHDRGEAISRLLAGNSTNNRNR